MEKYLYIILFIGLFFISGCIPIGISENNIDVTNVSVNDDYVGHQYNAWDNELTGVDGLSNIVDTKNNPHISIFTSTDSVTELEVYVSENCVDFILCEDLSTEINAPSGFTAHIFFTAGARCYQLKSSNNVLANATIVAKK